MLSSGNWSERDCQLPFLLADSCWTGSSFWEFIYAVTKYRKSFDSFESVENLSKFETQETGYVYNSGLRETIKTCRFLCQYFI